MGGHSPPPPLLVGCQGFNSESLPLSQASSCPNDGCGLTNLTTFNQDRATGSKDPIQCCKRRHAGPLCSMCIPAPNSQTGEMTASLRVGLKCLECTETNPNIIVTVRVAGKPWYH